MATMITNECIGFHDYEACAAVCPVDCCVTDPNNVETEEVLIARARALHQDVNFEENFQSRFRKANTEQKSAAAMQQQTSPASSLKPPAEQKTVSAPKPVANVTAAKPRKPPRSPKPTPQVKKEV